MLISIIISIVIAQAAGYIGSIFTAPNVSTWYAQLHQPSFTPPDWVFMPVWLLLYTLMGIAAALIWHKRHESKLAKWALLVYLIQLVLNALWSYLFFELHNLAWAFLEIMVLLLVIGVTMCLFCHTRKAAGWLMFPYFLWVAFAALLNFSFWMLNIQG